MPDEKLPKVLKQRRFGKVRVILARLYHKKQTGEKNG